MVVTNTAEETFQLKPFNGGMFSVETMKVVQGTDPQMTSVKFQLLERSRV